MFNEWSGKAIKADTLLKPQKHSPKETPVFLPCPICGSQPRFWQWNYGAIVECWCADHRIQCEAKTLKEATLAWNRRYSTDEPNHPG